MNTLHELKGIRADIEAVAISCKDGPNGVRYEWIARLDAAIAALEAGRSAEPVAWQTRWQQVEAEHRSREVGEWSDWCIWTDLELAERDHATNTAEGFPSEIRALYAAAPQQPAPSVSCPDDLDVERVREIEAALPGDDTQAHRALHSLAADLAHQRDDNRRLYRLSQQEAAPSVSEDEQESWSCRCGNTNHVNEPCGLCGARAPAAATVSKPAYTKADDLLHTIGGVEHPDAASGEGSDRD